MASPRLVSFCGGGDERGMTPERRRGEEKNQVFLPSEPTRLAEGHHHLHAAARPVSPEGFMLRRPFRGVVFVEQSIGTIV